MASGGRWGGAQLDDWRLFASSAFGQAPGIRSFQSPFRILHLEKSQMTTSLPSYLNNTEEQIVDKIIGNKFGDRKDQKKSDQCSVKTPGEIPVLQTW